MSKYNARRTTIQGHQFDSHSEAMRYCQLELMQEAGLISGLVIHQQYILQDKFTHGKQHIRAITYEADFSYTENGRQVVEDVKGVKTPAYQIKRKMFLYRYPEIDFREIEA